MKVSSLGVPFWEPCQSQSSAVHVQVHNYPHCWRSDTPLIYRAQFLVLKPHLCELCECSLSEAIPSWFIKVEEARGKLIANNNKTFLGLRITELHLYSYSVQLHRVNMNELQRMYWITYSSHCSVMTCAGEPSVKHWM